MKMTCDVIRDLLPLYAEDLASENSKKIVGEHLEACADCRRALESIRGPALIPAGEEPAIGNVRREIARRRWMAVGSAVLLLCAVLAGVLNWLTAPIYLDESVITAIEPGEMGTVSLTLDAAAAGQKTFQFEIDPTEAGETFVIWTNRWLQNNWNEPIPRNLTISRAVTHNGVYLFTGREGEENLLIYENPRQFVNGGVMMLPQLVLGLYFRMALVLGAACMAAALLLRKRRAGKLLRGGGSLLWCYALCQGIICGFTFTSWYAHLEFVWAVAMALCLWGGLTLAGSARRN